jgi:tRNA-dihydrouridine synthase
MSVTSNNATAPSPAIAPGAEHIDPAAIARRIGREGVDPRLRALVPAFDAPFFQAGLAGYSDAAMRLIARKHGCPFCVTEALLDRTLIAGGRGFTKADLGELHDNIPGGVDDHPLACQIMGSDSKEFAASALKVAEQGVRGDKFYRLLAYRDLPMDEIERRAAHSRMRIAERSGNPDQDEFDPTEGLEDCADACEDQTCETLIDEVNRVETGDQAATDRPARDASDPRASLAFEVIDVNLACPVKKIKAKARGGHWLAEPEGAIEILRAVREAVPKETICTVKLRRSYDDTPEMVRNFEHIFNAAYELGYSWTTVHARTVQQKYVGPSRWTFLKDLVARHPDKLVFGSGDVWEVEDIFRMIGYAGVAAVSVARGCIGNPWIFRQAREMMAGTPPSKPTIAEQRDVLEEHFRLAVRVQGEDVASRTMRKFAIWFAAHHPSGEQVRREFIAVESVGHWRDVLARWYVPAE